MHYSTDITTSISLTLISLLRLILPRYWRYFARQLGYIRAHLNGAFSGVCHMSLLNIVLQVIIFYALIFTIIKEKIISRCELNCNSWIIIFEKFDINWYHWYSNPAAETGCVGCRRCCRNGVCKERCSNGAAVAGCSNALFCDSPISKFPLRINTNKQSKSILNYLVAGSHLSGRVTCKPVSLIRHTSPYVYRTMLCTILCADNGGHVALCRVDRNVIRINILTY